MVDDDRLIKRAYDRAYGACMVFLFTVPVLLVVIFPQVFNVDRWTGAIACIALAFGPIILVTWLPYEVGTAWSARTARALKSRKL